MCLDEIYSLKHLKSGLKRFVCGNFVKQIDGEIGTIVTYIVKIDRAVVPCIWNHFSVPFGQILCIHSINDQAPRL